MSKATKATKAKGTHWYLYNETKSWYFNLGVAKDVDHVEDVRVNATIEYDAKGNVLGIQVVL